jgi:hypothetical protein
LSLGDSFLLGKEHARKNPIIPSEKNWIPTMRTSHQINERISKQIFVYLIPKHKQAF